MTNCIRRRQHIVTKHTAEERFGRKNYTIKLVFENDRHRKIVFKKFKFFNHFVALTKR